jgi:hypothetical protein
MKELYRGFKKVSEDEQSATLRHENGHELTVAKSGLNKNTLKMLKELPLYQADGTELGNGQAAEDLQKEMAAAKAGETLPEEPTYSGTPTTQTELMQQQPAAKAGGIDTTSPEYQQLAQSWGGPENIPQNVIDDLINRGAPGFGSTSTKQAQQEVAGQQAKAALAPPAEFAPRPLAQETALPQPGKVTGQSKAAAAKAPAKPRTPDEILADPQASVAEKYAAHMQKAASLDQEMKAEDERFAEAMKNDEIQPNRIYGNMDFGQKLSTIVGLIMGGLGAGLTGGPNVVQKMLDKQIEMDVEEQKRQSEKKQNLYKIHLERLGNQKEAEIATANNLRQIALVKMEQAAGLLGGNKAAQTRLQAGMMEQQLKYEQSRTALTNAILQRQDLERAKTTGAEVPDIRDPRIEKAVRVMVPGQPGLKKMYVRNPQEVSKIQEKASALASVKQTLDNLGKIYAESSSSVTGLSGKRREDAMAELAQAKLDLLKAQDLSPKLADDLNAILGSAGLAESFKPGFTGKAEERRRKALTIINQLSKTLIEGSLIN